MHICDFRPQTCHFHKTVTMAQEHIDRTYTHHSETTGGNRLQQSHRETGISESVSTGFMHMTRSMFVTFCNTINMDDIFCAPKQPIPNANIQYHSRCSYLDDYLQTVDLSRRTFHTWTLHLSSDFQCEHNYTVRTVVEGLYTCTGLLTCATFLELEFVHDVSLAWTVTVKQLSLLYHCGIGWKQTAKLISYWLDI